MLSVTFFHRLTGMSKYLLLKSVPVKTLLLLQVVILIDNRVDSIN